MKLTRNRFFLPLFLTITSLFMVILHGCRIFTPSGSSGVPGIQIVNPRDGDTISVALEVIQVQINSSEETRKVRFFDNNLFLGEDFDEPFEHVWEIAYVSIGGHELSAEAIDASGNVGRSATIEVYVSKEGLFDWSVVNSPISEDLLSVFGVDSLSVWACGTNGTLLRFDGSQWTFDNIPVGVNEDLRDLFFISSTRGWCIGDNIMLSYDAGGWLTLLSFTKKQLSSLFVFDDSTGWVGDGDGFIYSFDGDTIIEYGMLDTAIVTDILGISASDVWASCGNSIFHFDGSVWARDTSFPGEQVHALSSFAGTTIWAAGTGLFRYDGVDWEITGLPVLNGKAYGIFLPAQDTGIICGERQGVGFAWSVADTIWTEMSMQRDFPLYDLCGFADGTSWAVGAEGTILRRNAR